MLRAMPQAGQGLGVSEPQAAHFPAIGGLHVDTQKAIHSKMNFGDRLLELKILTPWRETVRTFPSDLQLRANHSLTKLRCLSKTTKDTLVRLRKPPKLANARPHRKLTIFCSAAQPTTYLHLRLKYSSDKSVRLIN